MNGGGEIVLMVDQLEQMERERHATLVRETMNLTRRMTNIVQRRHSSLVAETRRLNEHLTRLLTRLEKEGAGAVVDPLGEVQGAGSRIDVLCAQFAQAQEMLDQTIDLHQPDEPAHAREPEQRKRPGAMYANTMTAFMTSEEP